MHTNPLKTLGTFGQSLWLDCIRRDLITSGQLRRLIEEDRLRGMTSNPAIFEKAIVDSHEYDEDSHHGLGGERGERDL
jgi:transaldolase